MEHSNYVRFVVGWILTPNHENHVLYIAFAQVHFLAKIWPTLESALKTSFERSFHADHSGTIPSFISHSHSKVRCISFDTLDTNWCWAFCVDFTRYLGLGMRYEAGICTIVISMKGPFKRCLFCYRLNFYPKSWKTMDSLWLSAILGKNEIMKNIFRASFQKCFHADHNRTIPIFISHSHTKMQCDFPWIMNTWSRN